MDGDEADLIALACLYNKRPSEIRITSHRVLIFQNNLQKVDIPFTEVEKFRRSALKEDKPTDENSTAKFRVISKDGKATDIVIKGEECDAHVGRLMKICKHQLKESQKEVETRREEEEEKVEETGYDDSVPIQPLAGVRPEDIHKTCAERWCSENPEQAKLFAQFQSEGMDLWGVLDDYARRELVAYEVSTDYQRCGYSSEMLSDVQADAGSKANELRYTFSKDVQMQIFRKKPQILRKYRLWVKRHYDSKESDGISVEDKNAFWEQYVAAQFLKKAKKKEAKEAKDNFFHGESLEETVKFDSPSRLRRARALVPDVESGEMKDSLAGEGLLSEDLVVSVMTNVIDRVNMHSEIALIETGVIPDTISPIEKVEPQPLLEMKRLEDLEMPVTGINGTELNVKRIAQSEGQTNTSGPEFMRASQTLQRDLLEYCKGFRNIPSPPVIGAKDSMCVLKDLDSNMLIDADLDNLVRQSKASESVSIARESKLEQMILLFGFWKRRAKRNKSAITVRDRLKELLAKDQDRRRRAIYNDQTELLVSPLYDDIEKCFDRVFACYEAPAPTSQATSDLFSDFFV